MEPNPAYDARRNAEINAAIDARAEVTFLGQDLLDAGFSTVALDEDGVLTELHPDGTRTSL